MLHGFTGNPQSMRGLAVALADAGFTVELPLLPGHGTAVEDMLDTRWKDWSHAAEQAYMNWPHVPTRSWWWACPWAVRSACGWPSTIPRSPRSSLVNPLLMAPDEDTLAFIGAMIDAGDTVAPGIGSDIALEGAVESAYPGLPLQAALSLFEGVAEVEALLGQVGCPVLVFTSTQDHVVDPKSSALLMEKAKGPVDQVVLERSFHVATLDYDKDEIETRTVEFLSGVLPPPA